VSNAVEQALPLPSDAHLPLEDASGSRVPVQWHDRVYSDLGNTFFTGISMGSASYGYLVGSALIALGTTWILLAGYALGLVIGTALTVLSASLISYRFGIDSVDASKTALGTRGSLILVCGIILVPLAWANVTFAMTTVGIGALLPAKTIAAISDGWLSPLIGLCVVGVVWILLRKGAPMMERITFYSSLIQIAVIAVVIAIIAVKFDMRAAFRANATAAEPLASDRLLQLTYGIEYGVINALALFPTFGGIARLTKHRRHLVTPWVVGYALIGCMLATITGALAAVITHKIELNDYIVGVTGPSLGTALLILIMLANVGTLLVNLFVSALGLQQVSLFARLRWREVTTAIILPSVVVAFFTHWLLNQVMAILAYGGVIFVGITAVVGVDYLILRNQRVSLQQVFVPNARGRYWFWGGVNWVAVLVIVGSCALYLWLFDPVSLRVQGPFRWLGASIPSVAAAALVYYVLMRLVIRGTDRGGYRTHTSTGAEPVEVRL
jgi:nucleobase:cation symporter-1, NCS1 family